MAGPFFPHFEGEVLHDVFVVFARRGEVFEFDFPFPQVVDPIFGNDLQIVYSTGESGQPEGVFAFDRTTALRACRARPFFFQSAIEIDRHPLDARLLFPCSRIAAVRRLDVKVVNGKAQRVGAAKVLETWFFGAFFFRHVCELAPEFNFRLPEVDLGRRGPFGRLTDGVFDGHQESAFAFGVGGPDSPSVGKRAATPVDPRAFVTVIARVSSDIGGGDLMQTESAVGS